ncbi:hypothetical protein JYK21_31985 [Ralstonia pickettii]|nr:hypothetical protein [Ralstonia pickettii]
MRSTLTRTWLPAQASASETPVGQTGDVAEIGFARNYTETLGTCWP